MQASHRKLADGFGVVTVPNHVCRLSSAIRQMAARFLVGEFGLAMKGAEFDLAKEEIANLSPDMTYATAVLRIAERSPLRVLPEERIVGAATLLEATWHKMPLLGVESTSHTTIGFEAALKTGYRGLRERIVARLRA